MYQDNITQVGGLPGTSTDGPRPTCLDLVNPQAVNEPGFDVFTANSRSILYMKESSAGVPVVFVAIGALLVGSIKWTGGGKTGGKVARGEELGHVFVDPSHSGD